MNYDLCKKNERDIFTKQDIIISQLSEVSQEFSKVLELMTPLASAYEKELGDAKILECAKEFMANYLLMINE